MSRVSVSIVIAAYNEADILLQKVKNCFELDYPKDLLEIIVVTDGSNDDSEKLLSGMHGVRVYHSPIRGGKRAAIERVMPFVTTPIVVLTDANCMLNREALLNIVRHYDDPRVGAVAGEKKVRQTGAGSGEGLYWKYESWLKKTDSELYSVVGAAGELFSFRKELFEDLPQDTIIEDFVLSLRIVNKGFRVVYEPEACALENPSANFAEEWKRKVRICAGGFQATFRYSYLLNPLKNGWLSYLLLSHRVLRWAVVPFLLPIIFVLTLLLGNELFFQALLLAQFVVYGIALLGLFYWTSERIPKLISIPFQFLMMNAAAYAGIFRYWRGNQSSIWEKSKRGV